MQILKLCWKVLKVTGCLYISEFASLECVPVGITSSAVGLNICAIIAGIKKYKSIMKYYKILVLQKEEKDKLNTIENLILKGLIDSYISYDKFVSVNNLLREYYQNKKKLKNPETSVEHIILK